MYALKIVLHSSDYQILILGNINFLAIEILFVELDKNGDIIWKAKGEFLPSDIHHQYGIVFKTPQYRHARLDNEVSI